MKRHYVKTLKSQYGGTVFLFCALLLVGSSGCQELVHMGQVSDRDGGFCVGGVKVEQLQSDGSWAQLGVTDGNGRWWILKEKMKGGGKIRMSKSGYYPIVMSESEFLQQFNLLLTPTDSSSSFGDPTRDLGSSPR